MKQGKINSLSNKWMLSNCRNSSHHSTHRATEAVPHFVDRVLFEAIKAVSCVGRSLERSDDSISKIEKRIARIDDGRDDTERPDGVHRN